VRWLDELDGEQELDGADKETAQVETERDGTQRQRHLVEYNVFGRWQELKLVLRRLLVGRGRDFQEEDEGEEGKEQGDETQEPERRDHAFDAGLSRHVHRAQLFAR